jgi:hypothetical protein
LQRVAEHHGSMSDRVGTSSSVDCTGSYGGDDARGAPSGERERRPQDRNASSHSRMRRSRTTRPRAVCAAWDIAGDGTPGAEAEREQHPDAGQRDRRSARITENR